MYRTAKEAEEASAMKAVSQLRMLDSKMFHLSVVCYSKKLLEEKLNLHF